MAIREEALGPSHPDVAETLDRLGEFLVARADHRAARPVFERVLTILEQTYGPDHPHVGAARQHLAVVLAATGETASALRMALETERIGRDHLRTIGRTLPEREALIYAAARPAGLDLALTLIAHGENGNRSSSGLVWDAVVRSRAVVLDEMALRHRSVRAAEEPDLARLVDELASKRDQLARLVVRGPGASQEQYRTEIGRAREARDAAERAVAERSVVVQREQFQRRIGLDEVRAGLPRQSALVAFVRYQQLPLQARPESRPVTSYLAFVVRAGDPGSPPPDPVNADPVNADPVNAVAVNAVPLGPAATIDQAIAQWRREIKAVAFAGGRSTVRAEAAVRRSGARLRASIWDPAAPHLADATRDLIVPDGPLHLVTWDALPAPRGGYLVEHAPPFHYASAERDLVKDEQRAGGQGLLVVDSPVFDQHSRRTVGVSDTTARRLSDGAAGLNRAPFEGRHQTASSSIHALRSAARLQPGGGDDCGDLAKGSSCDRGRGGLPPEWPRRDGSGGQAARGGRRVRHLATHGFSWRPPRPRSRLDRLRHDRTRSRQTRFLPRTRCSWPVSRWQAPTAGQLWASPMKTAF